MPGGELFYYDSNPGSAEDSGDFVKPTVVLIHGLGDEADTWRHVFPLFTEAGYRLIAPDMPGFGRSLWKGKISIRSHTKAIIRLIDQIVGAAPLAAPLALIGSSLGAGIAQMIAFKRPDLVKALVLIGGCFPIRSSVNKALLFMGLPFFGKGWYRSFRTNHDAAWSSLYPYYGDLDAMSGEDRDFLRRRVIDRVASSNQERGYFATLRSMNAFLLFGTRSAPRKIKACSGKMLLIWGERDHIVPQKKTALIRSLRPDAGFALIPGAGHLPHQEKPNTVADEILRFLQEVS